MIDLSGRVVLNKIMDAEENVSLDVSALSKGMYFVSIELENQQIITNKFIKL